MQLSGTKILMLVCACLVTATNQVKSWRINGDHEDCDEEDLKNPTDGVLRYAQNTTNRLIAFENSRAQISCEVENYCNIDWFDVESRERIVEEEDVRFEDEKQTLVFLRIKPQDARLYSCHPSRGKHKLKPNEIMVHVTEKNVDSGVTPVLPNHGCQSVEADIGENVSIFCEYSVGTVEASPISTEWLKWSSTHGNYIIMRAYVLLYGGGENVTTVYEDICPQQGEPRKGSEGTPDLWIYNATLNLWNISEEAYGYYQINYKTDEGSYAQNLTVSRRVPPPAPITVTNGLDEFWIALAAVVMVTALCTSAVVYKQRDIKLYMKDNWSKECKNDGKESDAYISYSHNDDEDLNFVLHTLKVELEKQQYKVVIRDVHHTPGAAIVDEIINSLDTSRRCILVISPSYLRSWVGNYDINAMMDKVKSCKRQIIPIKYKDITLDGNHLKLLRHIMEMGTVLTWPKQSSSSDGGHVEFQDGGGGVSGNTRHGGDTKGAKKLQKEKDVFYKDLLLKMPPRRLLKKSQQYKTTISQVPMLENEERKSSFEENKSSFEEASNYQVFAPMYPSLNQGYYDSTASLPKGSNNLQSTDFSSNMATPASSQVDSRTQHNGGSKLYPVIT